MSKKDPTVAEVYSTFSSLKKSALEIVVGYIMGYRDADDADVRNAATIINSMPEPDKTVAYFIVGHAVDVSQTHINMVPKKKGE